MSDHWPIILAIAVVALAILVLTSAARRRPRSTSRDATDWARDLIAMPGRLRGVASDPRTPRQARWLLVALVFYIASPIDLIPDFIPLLGQLDDVVVVAIALAAIHRMIPDEVWADHFPGRPPGER